MQNGLVYGRLSHAGIGRPAPESIVSATVAICKYFAVAF